MENLIQKFEIFIDKAGKLVSRFKTVGILLVITLFIISLITNGCNRQQANELFEKVTGLNIQNDLLQTDIKQRQQEAVFKDMAIVRYKAQLAIKENENKELRNDNNNLKKERDADVRDIIAMPVDSSYEFLIKKAYPYKGELKFPFNEPQVKFIHLTYLERLNLQKQNGNLISQISNYESQLLYKDTIYEEEMGNRILAESNVADYKTMVANKDEEIALKDDELSKKGNGLLWKIVAGVLAVIVIAK